MNFVIGSDDDEGCARRVSLEKAASLMRIDRIDGETVKSTEEWAYCFQ